jgi:hypothetical protein
MQGTRRFWLHVVCTWLLLAATGSSLAQGLTRGENTYTLPPGSMPSWTVPVLRLVSATHVEPTTGVILSDTGLVLVPEDFAGMGDEIIVLDGGTDIIRNGRPARIERKFTAEGLQVLFVEGLKRQGVTLAATPLEEGDPILLAAFPPAELIAQGEPPLSIPATVVVFNETGRPSISSETELPNVTGALVDSCGNLVGVSLADDIQSMETSPATRYQWRETLLLLLGEMQVTPHEFNCSGKAQEVVSEPEPELGPKPEPKFEPEPEPIIEEPVAQEVPIPEDSVEPESEEDQPIEELPPDILPPIEDDVVASPVVEKETGTGGWLWLLAAAILIGSGFVFHRLRKANEEDSAAETEATAADPESALGALEEEPSAPEPLLDSLLLIQGVLADGTTFEESCAVSENAINILIGRGDTDLVIDSPAVSRQHISLNGTRNELTVSDLGSSNGTSINGVPCLEGEIMFIEPGDMLVMGDARCSLEIRPRKNSGSEKE